MKMRAQIAAVTPHEQPNGTKRHTPAVPIRRRSAKQPEGGTVTRTAGRKSSACWPAFRKTLRPGLERDTDLMPWLMAETVCGEVASFLGVEIPIRYAAWIEARAELTYAKGGHFRKLMRGQGNAPRDWLRVFMRHWLAGVLGIERPDLYECLPDTFALGHPLPPPVHPRRRWHGNGKPLHPPMEWDPQRVLRHRRWQWLLRRFPARMDAARQTLQNAITATEQHVDALVYDLYGLTADEIKLVEGTA
jgi:hypothetical protein